MDLDGSLGTSFAEGQDTPALAVENAAKSHDCEHLERAF